MSPKTFHSLLILENNVFSYLLNSVRINDFNRKITQQSMGSTCNTYLLQHYLTCRRHSSIFYQYRAKVPKTTFYILQIGKGLMQFVVIVCTIILFLSCFFLALTNKQHQQITSKISVAQHFVWPESVAVTGSCIRKEYYQNLHFISAVSSLPSCDVKFIPSDN